MSGAPKQNRSASDVIDLDVMLADRALAPKNVKLRGHTYSVRTDLTPSEVIQYHVLADTDQNVDAFRIVVGDDAELLVKQWDTMPKDHWRRITHAILDATGCFDGLLVDPDGDEGESSASSSESSDQTGTPPSSPSAARTSSTSARSSSSAQSASSSRSTKASASTGERTKKTPRAS